MGIGLRKPASPTPRFSESSSRLTSPPPYPTNPPPYIINLLPSFTTPFYLIYILFFSFKNIFNINIFLVVFSRATYLGKIIVAPLITLKKY